MSDAPSPDDPHAPYIRDLAAAGDWAALVRYCIAHGLHAPALDLAIDILRDWTEAGDTARASLFNFFDEFRADPFDFESEAPEMPAGVLDAAEAVTIGLASAFPLIVLCEMAGQLPIEHRDAGFRVGIATAEQFLAPVSDLPDPALLASLHNLQAAGHQAMNELEGARRSYDEALAIRRALASARPGVYEADVAMTLNNLGNVQRALNELEGARRSYDEALAIRRALASARPGVYEAVVASTLNNLGNVQRALNELEGARRSYDEALAIRRALASARPGVYEAVVASTLNNLGNVQRALNELEGARRSYDEALAIRRALASARPGVYEADVAMTLNNLGNVQSDLNELEDARRSYDEALALYRALASARPGVYEAVVAMTLNNLGNVQRALNELEGARLSYDEALALYRALASARPGVYEAVVAMTLNNLGTVQRALNELEDARRSYVEALAIRRALASARPGVYEADVAMTLNNLGNVQSDLNELEDARRSYDEALALYRALASARPGVYEAVVAMTLNNLGNVQRALNELEGARLSYDEALALYRALASARPGVYEADVAMTLNNLGTVQSDLNELEGARRSYDEALKQFEAACRDRPTTLMVERMRCWYNWGQLFTRDEPGGGWRADLDGARAAFRKAVDLAEIHRGRFADERNRRNAQERHLGVYGRLIATCIDLWGKTGDRGALEEAVWVAEASRARQLMELLAEKELPPRDVPPDLIAAFFQLRRHLEAARRRAEAPAEGDGAPAPDGAIDGDEESGRRAASAPDAPPRPGPGRAAQQLQKLLAEHAESLAWIRKSDPGYDPDRPVPPIDFDQVVDLIPRDVPTAIVHYTFLADRGLALVITADGIHPVELPDFGEAIEAANAWRRAYYVECRDPKKRLDFAAWRDRIDDLLEPVAAKAVRPVVESLVAGQKIKRLILVPSWVLHLFPLHACRLADGGVLIDSFDEVVTTPSLSILRRCARRARPEPARLRTFENPTGNLAFPEVEAAAAGRHFVHHDRHRRAGVDRARLLAGGSGCDVWHYSGHSFFQPDAPMDSGLVLAGDEPLTLRDIYLGLRLDATSLAVLSGCESGNVSLDRVGDYSGLSAGLLYAGATCVLASLWCVDDPATALLMDAFYREWRQKRLTVAAALAEAQRWLRGATGIEVRDRLLAPDFLDQLDADHRDWCVPYADSMGRCYPDTAPFASPAYWGAFTAVGWGFATPP